MNNNNQEFYIDREEGYFIAIVGSSGCGKSTLLSIICDLENKTDGEIIFYKDNSIIGYMLQEDALFNHLTIYENIILVLKILTGTRSACSAQRSTESSDVTLRRVQYREHRAAGFQRRITI